MRLSEAFDIEAGRERTAGEARLRRAETHKQRLERCRHYSREQLREVRLLLGNPDACPLNEDLRRIAGYLLSHFRDWEDLLDCLEQEETCLLIGPRTGRLDFVQDIIGALFGPDNELPLHLGGRAAVLVGWRIRQPRDERRPPPLPDRENPGQVAEDNRDRFVSEEGGIP